MQTTWGRRFDSAMQYEECLLSHMRLCAVQAGKHSADVCLAPLVVVAKLLYLRRNVHMYMLVSQRCSQCYLADFQNKGLQRQDIAPQGRCLHFAPQGESLAAHDIIIQLTDFVGKLWRKCFLFSLFFFFFSSENKEWRAYVAAMYVLVIKEFK